jgi:hypothetical protein
MFQPFYTFRQKYGYGPPNQSLHRSGSASVIARVRRRRDLAPAARGGRRGRPGELNR